MENTKWVLKVPEESNGWSEVVSFNGVIKKNICTIYGGQLRDENKKEILGKISNESKKTGLLISKAPEMLEMLKELLIDVEEMNMPSSINDTVSRLRKLIKEATEL